MKFISIQFIAGMIVGSAGIAGTVCPGDNLRIHLQIKGKPALISTIEVLKPVDVCSLNNEYQQLLAVEDLGGKLRLKIRHVLISDYNSQITGDRFWRRNAVNTDPWVRPGLTANWTQELKQALLAAGLKAGYNFEKMDDKSIVEVISAWVSRRPTKDNSVQYYFTYQSGHPELLPGAKVFAQQATGLVDVAEIVRAGLSGIDMAQTNTHGDCTGTAILQSTLLKALGIPTRIVVTVPAVDIFDQSQVSTLLNALSDSPEEGQVRKGIKTLKTIADSSNGDFIAHAFNEVMINGKWVKLNYSHLGQGNVWTNMGLMVQVQTFNDWSDASAFVESWGGLRIQGGLENHIVNPYRAISFQRTVHILQY